MKKVLVGLSGGVDSAVSAYLLKSEYEVLGCNMSLLYENGIIPVNEDAKRVADSLGIEYAAVNFADDFKDIVIKDFVDAYKTGLTPNPCVVCNRYFKFGRMVKFAKENGCDYISTGHYARVEYSDKYNRYVIKKSHNLKKDQTYFLHVIDKEVIPHIIFPLEKFDDKEQIRKIASDNNLPVASKKDSQDICFIKTDYKDYLLSNNYIEENKGNIVYKDGTILGEHEGVFKYTIGQRKGLKIAFVEPLYVIKLDTVNNQVIVGLESDLYKKEIEIYDVNLQAIDTVVDGMEFDCKIRYAAKPVKAKLYNIEGGLKVIFNEPQKSPTSGQSAVFYDDDILIGGGKIK